MTALAVPAARHGRHAAAARARRTLPVEQLRALRTAMEADPRGCRRTRYRWHPTSGQHELVDQLSTAGGPDGGLSDAELYGALHGKAWVWRYDPGTNRRKPLREGTESRLPWLGRWRYLHATVPLRLAQGDAAGILAGHKVDPATFRRWIRCETARADPRTGRRCVVRAVTVAAELEVDERTVKRCRAVARDLGLYATVHRGRMLRQMEQVRARWSGSPQRGMAAESWFVVPPELAVETAAAGCSSTAGLRRLGSVSCLHRGPTHGQLQSKDRSLVTVTTRWEMEPASPAATSKRRRRAPSPGYRLAERVVQRLPWARNCPPGRLSGVLGRFATAALPWTADDIVQLIDAVNVRRGWSAIGDVDELRAPAFALLASYLRDVDPVADHPRLLDLEAADRRTAAAATRAEHRRAGCWVPAAADSCPTCGERFAG